MNSNIQLNTFKYERNGKQKTFPTYQDWCILRIHGVVSMSCNPNSEDKYEKAILIDDIKRREKQVIMDKIQSIISPNVVYDRAFGMWP